MFQPSVQDKIDSKWNEMKTKRNETKRYDTIRYDMVMKMKKNKSGTKQNESDGMLGRIHELLLDQSCVVKQRKASRRINIYICILNK